MAGSAILNKQPIFTSTPILSVTSGDLIQNRSDTNVTDGATVIYRDMSTYGSSITKITVNANARLEDSITPKRIDLYISIDGGTTYSLFASKFMTGVAVIETSSTIPSVVFEFPNGLITPTGTYLGLTTTNNYDNTDKIGDLVSVVVEGGTYDFIPTA
jgi:hypothetical protein